MKIPFDFDKLSPFLAWVFRMWSRTIRYEFFGNSQNLLEQKKQGQALIIALWHGEIFPITGISEKANSNLVIFVSQSKDGEIIARVLEKLGHATVRGSSTRGGVKALLQAKRLMIKENRMAVFTIDGPKGPRHKAKDGIIFLAQRAEAKIIPVRAYPLRKKVFEKSWDRFIVPFPFTRCPLYIGDPMEVTTEKLDKEVLKRERARLEERMSSLGPQEKRDA
ncbi:MULTISPECIES: lysophospholipid acyltransferase family protein [unclassified Pseudodesulfovibrio]|uniref:lysophospholipid acyltransferase family protein n=1 Tax=unclassified Pseudodesulfovibrio TaxID=2661612 RepID=UPI000FEBD711|nr:MULTISPECIES: lysophospholipid acyltransferase family protein [unclassified Pseudodesulfovibrio]MCJ2163830.1 lysophospholipid acyltransferase family protein [Pseudodesulfovibrio sp. S3-i]RWU05923.1 DUF374 domain-containing protein [Pseudodesulfovibrio sp. S3]